MKNNHRNKAVIPILRNPNTAIERVIIMAHAISQRMRVIISAIIMNPPFRDDLII